MEDMLGRVHRQKMESSFALGCSREDHPDVAAVGVNRERKHSFEPALSGNCEPVERSGSRNRQAES